MTSGIRNKDYAFLRSDPQKLLGSFIIVWEVVSSNFYSHSASHKLKWPKHCIQSVEEITL